MRTFLIFALTAAGVVAGSVHDAAAQHEGHQQPKPPATEQKPTPRPTPAQTGAADHSQHHTPSAELPPFIPTLTDEDRKAAFPDVAGHAVHDAALNYFVLFDQLEWQSGFGAQGLNADTKGWVGGDRSRFWFRAEADSEDGRVGEAETHLLYGRQISRWWDVVGGVRQDVRPRPGRTWAAVGLQGLAPYWFEVELTGYVGAEGRTHFRGEVEYELLLTNRLVLQPLVEVEVFGKSDPERGIGAGLSTINTGFRLRYEFRRELAPYVGVTWNNKFGKTADFAEAAGEHSGGARLVSGVRLWF
jgi:copper resistance protein B